MTLTAPEQSSPPTPPATEYRDPRAYVKPEVWDREIALLMRDASRAAAFPVGVLPRWVWRVWPPRSTSAARPAGVWGRSETS
ncbi:hypothetical protein MBT42_38985 [Streptomyces sp. MBT42]|uniref:hypothetical protein n=1 Tax=Streptomyces sp. MBT42 TaxID=1488373 RepID=UPI001E616FA3|nr:hypothetical protein [Streptomyces sp. MBT42]MCD2469504.1 hypothetical protein [Streptomyces sp. MBT42]